MKSRNYKRINRGNHAMPTMTAAERFSKPFVVDSGIFGFTGDTLAIMPPMKDIPDEFKRWSENPFVRLQSEWFFNGLKKWPLKVRSGIDQHAALAHLNAIQRSWEPKHEHKVAAVAYLMSLWFEAPDAEARP